MDIDLGFFLGVYLEVVDAFETGLFFELHDLVDELIALALAFFELLETFLEIFFWLADCGGDIGKPISSSDFYIELLKSGHLEDLGL